MQALDLLKHWKVGLELYSRLGFNSREVMSKFILVPLEGISERFEISIRCERVFYQAQESVLLL